MKYRLAWLALWLVANVWQSPAWAAEGHLLALESGEVSGMYFPEAGAVCRMVNKDREHHGVRCLVEPTGGSVANLAALRKGDGQLAIVQSRVLAQAVQGVGAFAREPFPDLRTLMSLHGETMVVLVNPAAKIKSAADLKGKRVTLGHAGSFQRLMADGLLEAEGIATTDLAAALEMDSAKVGEALCRNEIDAAVFTGLHPMADVQEAIDDCGAGVLSLKDSRIDAFLKANPAYSRQILPDDTYTGVHEKTATFGVNAILVTTSSLPEEDGYAVVRAVFDGLPAFKAMHPLLGELEKKQMARDTLVAPLHEGALRYYKENGLQ
ncbi:TAXI family TRAP transporter solute-binding subunit [Telmatospirillum sp.]|uniref:TAXI family TRAP transporter solute-binding subunit n=1 Tax=Telmatospirillum sp. TaxID=2079197 RepID=UPI0028453F40|nr:TAXI family TRAP transporter solute-binding subunit [Telmatospirillum sp.]MDR3438778.1 TAXI family TRAP transporter solute-binding subunit [Telmatospirillum sp.]